jgi:archaellin
MIKMNDLGSTAIAAVILLISFILIAATVASIISSGSEGASEEEIEEMLDDILDELTTYIQIKDKLGKYSLINDVQQIKQIAILINPLISQDIEAYGLTIKLCDGNNVYILNYSGQATYIGSHGLFGHPIWNDINETNFGFLVIHDNDRSLIDYDVLNKDMAYVVINLSEEMAMVKRETMEVTLFPSSGITRTTILEAPLPMTSVVSFN